MGFWKRLFKRKKAEEPQDNWEELVYERDKVNFKDEEDRSRYLTSCLEQMGEAERELNLLNGEYSLVTSYLMDMEEIEALPPEQASEIKTIAGKLINLEQERLRYQAKRGRMTNREYHQMRAQESEIEDGIAKLREAEKYQKLVKQDLMRLDGERHAYAYRRMEQQNIMINMRGMAVICMISLGACILMLLVLQFGFSMDAAIGYYLAVAAAGIAITVLFVKYTDAGKELDRVGKAENKLIQLQNKVKIRYVNNVNLLNYLYLKYGVENSAKLQALWDLYQAEKEERRQYAEAEAKLEYNRKELTTLLARYRVKDPERWVQQPAALVDSREMLEIRHGLIVRRQELRKQIDYNRNLAQTAQQEVREVATQYPQYAEEIAHMVEMAEDNFNSQ